MENNPSTKKLHDRSINQSVDQSTKFFTILHFYSLINQSINEPLISEIVHFIKLVYFVDISLDVVEKITRCDIEVHWFEQFACVEINSMLLKGRGCERNSVQNLEMKLWSLNENAKWTHSNWSASSLRILILWWLMRYESNVDMK